MHCSFHVCCYRLWCVWRGIYIFIVLEYFCMRFYLILMSNYSLQSKFQKIQSSCYLFPTQLYHRSFFANYKLCEFPTELPWFSLYCFNIMEDLWIFAGAFSSDVSVVQLSNFWSEWRWTFQGQCLWKLLPDLQSQPPVEVEKKIEFCDGCSILSYTVNNWNVIDYLMVLETRNLK